MLLKCEVNTLQTIVDSDGAARSSLESTNIDLQSKGEESAMMGSDASPRRCH